MGRRSRGSRVICKVTSVLLCVGVASLGCIGLYRLVWRLRQGDAGGLARRVGHVVALHGDRVEVRCAGGQVGVLDRPRRSPLTVGDAVTLTCIEVGTQIEGVAVRRGIWPELRWLRWPGLGAALLCVGLLLWDDPRPAVGSIVVQVEHRVRAPAVNARRFGASPDALRALQRRVRPLHHTMGKVRWGDWLSQHPEPGQTFEQYRRSHPMGLEGSRKVIYIQPIGAFEGPRARILSLTADFMSRYFCLEVRVARPLPLSLIPARARRRHPTWGVRQVLAPYVLDNLLRPRLPADAAAYVGFTTSDLWPGPGWNFVFGQASLRDRVGVWSIHRNGEVDTPQAFARCLLRTIKTAVHETGHMFSMQHCTAYECNMCGSNSQVESDHRPITLCPECLAKQIWVTGCDPWIRYRGLRDFFRQQQMTEQEQIYDGLLALHPGGV